MKHTPGPWRLSNTISAYECKRRKIVASEESAESGTGICEVYGIEDECNVANARLIAAAPEMLEALQSAMRIKDLWLPIGDVSDEHAEELKALSLMAMKFESVIKKATGTDAAQTSARGE